MVYLQFSLTLHITVRQDFRLFAILQLFHIRCQCLIIPADDSLLAYISSTDLLYLTVRFFEPV